MLEQAGDGWVSAAMLKVDDDSAACGCVLNHADDVVWGGDSGWVDGDVADYADLAHCVVGCVGCFGVMEEWEEGWCVGRGHSMVWCEGDVELSAADGVAVDAVVV